MPNTQPAHTMGRPVRTEHVPTRMAWLDRQGHPIPDFDNGLILNVSDRAKALVERLEPGVHQFLPVDYYDARGDLVERRHFLIVCNRLDSLDRARTTMVLSRGVMWRPAREVLRRRPEDIPPGFDVHAEPRMVFNRA